MHLAEADTLLLQLTLRLLAGTTSLPCHKSSPLHGTFYLMPRFFSSQPGTFKGLRVLAVCHLSLSCPLSPLQFPSQIHEAVYPKLPMSLI